MSNQLKQLLHHVQTGKMSPEDAYDELKNFEDLGYVKVDHHRMKRKGFPEVIYGEGKTSEQITETFKVLMTANPVVLATRISKSKALKITSKLVDLQYFEEARILLYSKQEIIPSSNRTIGIVCAGTSDLPIAEEAAVTAIAMGNHVKRFYDVGVAGIHRLFHCLDEIKKCSVLIVVAGMEGALPSVLGGLTSQPIIAVPTNIGYGAHFNGLAPLLAMLNSCASGITVVNIGNGFGAAYSASLINRIGVATDETN